MIRRVKEDICAPAAWREMRGRLIKEVCAEKPIPGREVDIHAKGYFSDRKAAARPQDFADGSSLTELEKYLRELKDRQESGTRFTQNGIRFTVNDDLSVTAEDISDIWAYICAPDNRPQAVVTFRDGIDAVIYNGVTIKRREDGVLFIITDAADACGFTDKMRLVSAGKEAAARSDRVYVSDGSVERFYHFESRTGRDVMFVRFTNTILGKYWKCIHFAHLTRYETHAGTADACFPPDGEAIIFPRMVRLGISGNIYKEEIEKIAGYRGRFHDGRTDKWLLERFSDMSVTDEEYRKAALAAAAAAEHVQRVIDGNAEEMLDAACAVLGVGTGLCAEEKMAALAEADRGSVPREQGTIRIYFWDCGTDSAALREGSRNGMRDTIFFRDGGFCPRFPYMSRNTAVMRAEAEILLTLLAREGTGAGAGAGAVYRIIPD